jgi:hypothetical protein
MRAYRCKRCLGGFQLILTVATNQSCRVHSQWHWPPPLSGQECRNGFWKQVDMVGNRPTASACRYLAHAVLSGGSVVAHRLGVAVRHIRLIVPIIFGLLLIPGVRAASAQISDGVVRIGLLNDQSSIYADDGGPGSVVAAHMAIEDAGRKVLGRPIELLVADHQNKADVGVDIDQREQTPREEDLKQFCVSGAWHGRGEG